MVRYSEWVEELPFKKLGLIAASIDFSEYQIAKTLIRFIRGPTRYALTMGCSVAEVYEYHY